MKELCNKKPKNRIFIKLKNYMLGIRVNSKLQYIYKKFWISGTLQWIFRTFLATRTVSNKTRKSSTVPYTILHFFLMFFRIRFDRTELCLFAFKWFNMIQLVHFNSFYEFGSIGSNPKKHQKNAKIRIRTISIRVRFGTVGTVLSSRKVLKFHCSRA